MSKLTLGLCSDWLLGGKGIMNVLTTNFNVPWKNKIDGAILDLDYYGNRSANKVVSPLVEKLVTSEGLSDEAMLRLATLIYNKYGDGWDRTALALAEEYNPIHNYDGTSSITETDTITGHKGNTLTKGESVINTGTQSDSGSVTYSGHEKNDNTREDLNVNQTNSGVVNTELHSFGTGNDERKTIVDEQGKTIDELDFGTGNDKRKDESTWNGDKVTSRNYDNNDNYKKTTKEWGKKGTKNKINAFNGGMVDTDETEEQVGEYVSSQTSPSESNSYQRTEAESGKYSDTEHFNNYTESTSKEGTETHTITKQGLSNNTPYNTTVKQAGTETVTNTAKDHTKFKTADDHYFENRSDTTTNTRTDNLTQRTDGTETGVENSSEIREHTYEETKGGNLGITTTQQMLTQEMDFRHLYNMFNTVVFPNVDAVMCLDIFGCEDLTLDDFTIINESSYILPVASNTVLGGIKIGEFLTIQSDGTVSVNMEHVTPDELASTLVDYAKKTDLNDYVTTALLSTTLQNYVTTSTLVTTLSNYVLNSSLQTTLLDYVTNSGLTTILADYVTSNNLATILSDYVTSSDLTSLLAQKQDTLVSGTNIKTINGVSLLGEGNIEIEGSTSALSLSTNPTNQGNINGLLSLEVSLV